MQNRILEGI